MLTVEQDRVAEQVHDFQADPTQADLDLDLTIGELEVDLLPTAARTGSAPQPVTCAGWMYCC